MTRAADGVKSVALSLSSQNRQGWFHSGCTSGLPGRLIYIPHNIIYLTHTIHIYSTGFPENNTLTILCIDLYKWMTIYLCYLRKVDTILALTAQLCPRLNSLNVLVLDFYLRISMFGAGRDAEGSRVGGWKRDTSHCDPSSPRVGDQVVTPVNRIKAM